MNREIEWIKNNSKALEKRFGRKAMCFSEYCPSHMDNRQIQRRLLSDEAMGLAEHYFKDCAKELNEQD